MAVYPEIPLPSWRNLGGLRQRKLCLSCCIILGLVFCDFALSKPVDSAPHSGNMVAHHVPLTDAAMEDCDWTGMTKSSVLAGGSVQQEYLRCATGRLNWLYPEGALHVTINPPATRHFPGLPTPKPTTAYRVCLTADLKTLQNVNVYLQDRDKLNLVFSPLQNKNSPGRPDQSSNQPPARTDRSVESDRRCFLQTHGVVTVYLESFLVEGLNFISATASATGQRVYTRLPATGAAEILYDIRAV